MSKVTNILEKLNELCEIENLIKICNSTMQDAEKLLLQDKDSVELKGIYEAAEHDKKNLIDKHEKLSAELFEMLESVEKDPEILKELESVANVQDEFKTYIEMLKKKLLSQSQNAREKAEE